MATKFALTWNGKQARWFKKYKGRQYAVSCKELETNPTKEESYKAAWSWWEAKKKELDEKPAEDFLNTALEQIGVDAKGKTKEEKQEYLNGFYQFPAATYPNDPKQKGKKTPEEINSQISLYMKKTEEDCEAGLIKPASFCRVKNAVEVYAKRFFEEKQISSVQQINASTLDSFYSWINLLVKQKELAISSASSRWQGFRSFIMWLGESGVIPMPLNINSKRFRFTLPKVKYRYWTKKEFQEFYGIATDRLKLYFLLAANCGFYASDIGNLKRSAYDSKKGTITTQRYKTGEDIDTDQYLLSSNVPEVTWFLWPETKKLLDKLKAKSGDLLLTNEDGGQLWKTKVVNGKFQKIDNIITAYKRFLKNRQIQNHNTMENLRKTSIQFLSSSKEYSRYAFWFGGWAEPTVKDKNYSTVTDKEAKEICEFLRSCYF